MLKLTFIAFCCLTNVSVAAEADEAAATSIADILNNAQMVDGKLAFDKPQFDKVVQKAMATEEGWGEIVAAMELPANNIDILYNTIRWTQKADKRQAFYEWALTKGGIKSESALLMIASDLAEVTRKCESDDVYRLINAKASLFNLIITRAFAESRHKEIEALAVEWQAGIGEDSGDGSRLPLVNAYLKLLQHIKSEKCDRILVSCVKQYWPNSDVSEIPEAIKYLASRKVPGAFDVICVVASGEKSITLSVVAVEALAMIAQDQKQKEQVREMLVKVRLLLDVEDPSDFFYARLDMVKRSLDNGNNRRNDPPAMPGAS